jgi:hypothetical protein
MARLGERNKFESSRSRSRRASPADRTRNQSRSHEAGRVGDIPRAVVEEDVDRRQGDERRLASMVDKMRLVAARAPAP